MASSDLNGLIVAFLIQAVIATVLFLVFCSIRVKNDHVYQPKITFGSEKKRPAPLGKGRFDWISSVLKLDERNHLSSLGLDAIMFLRFIKYCLTYFGGLFIVAIFLCVFNAYLPQMTGKSGYVETQLGYLTMQNMNAESSLIYVYTVLSWLFSLFAYWLLYRTWEDFVDLRKEHFATAEYQQAYHNRTIFLAMLPPKMRTNEAVASFLEKLEISAPFEQIMMGRDYGKLPELVKTHTEMNRKMESTIKAYYDKTERPMHRKSFMSKEKVDSMAFFSDKLHEFEEKIYTMRSVSDDRYTVNASALVSFPSTKAAADVIHLTQNKSYYCKKTGQLFTPSVKPCPPNEDIIWENLGLDEANVRTRRVLSYSIVAAITLLWTIIVAIVTSLTELSTIAKASPALADSLSRSAAGMLLLQSVIAPVLLVVLNMLVPIIFRKLTVMQGVRSHMGVERSVLGKYFVFQVYQVAAFIGASSVMNALIGGQSADPMTTLNEVINGFIKSSTFFITVMVLGFTGFAIEILQIGPLIMTWIKTKYFNLTPRDKFTMEQPPAFNPMAAYASTLVSLLLASTYSLIAPLMAPFAFVLFGLQYLIMKYLVFYVYRTDIENNGKWWPRLFKLSIYCIVISQLMAFGSMLLMFSTRSNSSNGYIASFLVLPLAFISWAFYHWMIQTRLRDANDPQFAVTPERRLELEVSLFNPCMGQPLEKVWVSASSGKVLAQDYAPEFISTKDFMEKKGTDSEVHHSRMAKRLVNYSESKTKDWEGCKSSEGIPPEWVQALDDVAGHETLPTSSTGTPVNEAV